MRLLLLGTAVIIQDIRYLMWILEMITCLSTELREEHFTISWQRKNKVLVCLWAAPKATAWPWYHTEAFLKHWIGNMFIMDESREAVPTWLFQHNTKCVGSALGVTSWWGPMGPVSVTPQKEKWSRIHHSVCICHPPTVVFCLAKSKPFGTRAAFIMSRPWYIGV